MTEARPVPWRQVHKTAKITLEWVKRPRIVLGLHLVPVKAVPIANQELVGLLHEPSLASPPLEGVSNLRPPTTP
jgi:hypothetical protein